MKRLKIESAPSMAAPLQQPEKAGPSPADLAVIREFVAYLEGRGFCRMAQTARDVVMPFNRFDLKEYAHAELEERFSEWLKENGRTCEFREVRYIVKLLPLIKGTKFRPGDRHQYLKDPTTGTRYGNSWTWYEPQGDSAEVSPLVHEFFERLIPDPRERRIFIQYLAHIVQRPWERPSWHIMLPSEPGTGKGFMVDKLLHPILRHTMKLSSYAQLMGQFSTVLESTLLVLLDDCKSKSDSTQTRLKSILSEETQYVERKHKEGGMVNCYTRFILASNEDRPLFLEPGERRWFVLTKAVHGVDLWETQRFIKRLAAWLSEPGSLDKVYRWLQGYDLTGFDAKAVPPSEGLARMIAMSESPVSAHIKGYIEDHPVFKRTDLTSAMKEEHGMRPSPKELPHLLREAGYEATRPRLHHFDGQKEWVCHPIGWTKDQIEAAFAALPVAEVPY